MKKNIFFLIKIALAVLAFGVLFLCIVPIRSNIFAHIILSPIEKKIQNKKIEFRSSSVLLPRYISLKDVSIIDSEGKLYYSKSADIKYNPFNLVFKKEGFFFCLKGIKFYRNIGLFDSVANILVISKMPDVEFEEISGILRLHKNIFYMKNVYAYNDLLRIKGNGWIDRDGTLDCDISFSFDKTITDKVPDTVRRILLMPEDNNWMGISFKAYGNYKRPSLHVSSERLKLNIMKELIGNE